MSFSNETCFLCEICSKTYVHLRSLKVHIKEVHETSETLECSSCNKHFRRKRDLFFHVRTQHLETERIRKFACELCDSKFTLKKYLTDHTKKVHLRAKDREANRSRKKKNEASKETFLCTVCFKKFSTRYNLKSHVQSIHEPPQEYECAECGRLFGAKRTLRAHFRGAHSDENLTCVRCGRTLATRNSFEEHLVKCFSLPEVTEWKSRMICLVCHDVFPKKNVLLKHYSEKHEICLKYEDLEFDSFELFENWKLRMECSEIVQFNPKVSHESTIANVKLFRCHRTGVFTESRAKESRIRRLKRKGSKKLQGFCPAEISVKQDKFTGKCCVRFQKIHVGHEIGSENELKHVYLDQSKRLNLAKKINEKVPFDMIIQNENELLMNEGSCNRKKNLTFQDLKNVWRSFVSDKFSKNEDIENTASFIQENGENILYFKQENEVKAPFEKNDFILVYMSNMQAEKLAIFANDCHVLMDSARGINSDEYHLHVLMVLNLNHIALPIAFLFTNKNEESVMTLFLECVKQKIGDLKIRFLLTNIHPLYYNAWIKVIPAPIHWLYCSRQVTQFWNIGLNKITKKKERNFLSCKLLELQTELDEDKFTLLLEEFLSMKNDAYDEFLQYFRSHFANETARWAYCFRKYTLLNTNNHLESFLKRLKYKGMRNKKLVYLSSFLHAVTKYVENQFFEEGSKIIGGHLLPKLKELHRTHKKAESTEFFFSKNTNFWDVISRGSAHIIIPLRSICDMAKYKEANEECYLKCEECQICFHQYRCSCMDYSINANICEHIHGLVMYLRNQSICDQSINLVSKSGISDLHDDFITEENDQLHEDDVRRTFKNITQIVLEKCRLPKSENM